MVKAITVRVKHDKPKGGAKRRRSSRPRGFPSSRFGAVYVPRGTPEGIAKYGNTWREADEAQRAARRGVGYYGRGLYTGHGGYWGRKIGSWFGMGDLGDKLGDLGGAAIRGAGGGALMDAANAASGALQASGHGAYAVNSTIAGGGSDDPVPHFSPATDGCSILISHTEYISDIFGPASPGFFQNTTYGINPALERTFPWLSQIAQNYTEYEFKQLIFTFKSTITDFNSGTGQVGTLIMATQYNPSDEAFADKATMMQTDLVSSGKLSSHQLHGVECDQSKLSGYIGKYTRSGPPTGAQDIKTYDLGVLNVACCNVPAQFFNQGLGELHVSYTLELRKPKQFTNKGWGISRDAFYLSTVTPWWDITTSANAIGYGQQNTIGCAIIPVYGAVDSTSVKGTANQLAYELTELVTVAGGPSTKEHSSIYIVWPATCEGNYRVRLTLESAAATTTVLAGGSVDMTGNENTLAVPHTNSLEPILDILQSNGHWWWSAVSDQTLPGKQTYEFHVRITNPAGADPGIALHPLNAAMKLTLSNQYFPGVAPTPDRYECYGNIDLQIENYNTIFNFAQSGVSDEPVVCEGTDIYTSSGMVVQTWPPAGYAAP